VKLLIASALPDLGAYVFANLGVSEEVQEEVKPLWKLIDEY
jgi:hypothetical protein